jgi:hypothetical protein
MHDLYIKNPATSDTDFSLSQTLARSLLLVQKTVPAQNKTKKGKKKTHNEGKKHKEKNSTLDAMPR